MSSSASPQPARTRSPLVATGVLVATLLGLLAACEPTSPPTSTTSTTRATTTTAKPSACKGTGSTATRDVPYQQVAGVAPSLLSLDFYKPIRPAGCGPAPIVFYVHGGGFMNGDKSNKINDKVKLFTGEGWVFASVNYRLSPSPPNNSPGQVRYPTHEQDVAAALAWLKGHSSQLGGDPTHIFLVGHSSGAFLVSLLSTDTGFLTSAGLSTANVRCTASLDTEYDIASQIAQGGSQEALYRNAFGNAPATWAVGSPMKHTNPEKVRPKFLVVTRGLPRRTAQAKAFANALVKAGTPASFVDVSPLNHEHVNAAVGAPGDTKVTPPLMTFLRSCA